MKKKKEKKKNGWEGHMGSMNKRITRGSTPSDSLIASGL